MSELRWEQQRDGTSLYAYSGTLVIGMVGRRTWNQNRVWYIATNAVSMKHIAKGNGEVSSVRAAKAAVDRAWKKWLAEANLRPESKTPADG